MNEIESLAIKSGVESGMTGEPLNAIQAEAQQVERVFLAWVESDTKRATDISKATGVPIAKVRKYIREGDFQERYNSATDRFRRAAAPYARTRAVELVDDVIQRLSSIIEHGQDKDAIAASRVLVSMMEDTDHQPEHVTNVDMRVLSIAESMIERGTVDAKDVRNFVRASMQSNVDQVEAQRASRSSK